MKNMGTLNDNVRESAPKNSVAALLVAVCFLLILAGCQNPLQRQDTDGTGTGTGTISLTINGRGAARTIMPPETTFDDFVRFELLFTPYNGGIPKSVDWCAEHDLAGGIGTVELGVGTWDLVVTAFVMEYDGEVAAARSGSYRIIVSTGDHVERDVLLLPIGGMGIFSWDIELSGDGIVSVRMEILRYSDRSAFRGPYYLAGGDAPIGLAGYLADLDAGQYFVVFTLSNGERNLRMTEVLRIYAYRTSHFEDTFSDGIFTFSLLHVILNTWNGGKWDFEGAGIEAGHFALLGIDGIDDGNGGFASGIVGWFDTLTYNDGDPIVLDYDTPNVLEQLKALVDAALIGIASADTGFLNAIYRTTINAQNAIANLAVNDTTITFAWIGDYTVIVHAGAYQVEIVFGNPVIIGIPVPGDTLAERLAWLRGNAQSGNYYYIEVNGDENITSAQASLPTGISKVTITIRGIGGMRTISLSDTGNLFTIGYGVTLVLVFHES